MEKRLLSLLLLGSLVPALHGMDDSINILAQKVEDLLPFAVCYSDELQDTVRSLSESLPEMRQEIHKSEQNALDLLDDLNQDIACFREAFQNNQISRCRDPYDAILVINDGLQELMRTLTFLKPVDVAPHSLTVEPAVPKPVVQDLERIKMRAVESGRIAQAAHLTQVPQLGQERYAIDFNPSKLSSNGINGIPASLRQLPGVQILYYPSPRLSARVPGTCGTRAIGNALGIRDSVLGRSLDAATVFKNAEDHDDINSHEGIVSDEEVNLAVALNLDNYHVIYFDAKYSGVGGRPRDNQFFIRYSSCYDDPRKKHERHRVDVLQEDNFQAQLIQEIRNSGTIVAYFSGSIDIYKPDDHAVLITIVKQEKRVPKIIYMDCNNNPVLDQSKAAAFMHYLYLQCIAP